jgi:hypothetical protein
MSRDQEDEAQKPSSRSWQDLGKQYRTIGIAAVAAAVEMFSAPEPKPAVRKKASIRYLGNDF